MKVIVFGGSGFVGSHIVDELLEKGYDVTVFDVHPSDYLPSGVKMLTGDIKDREQVNEAIKGQDYVFHLASIAGIKDADDDPILTTQTNLMSTLYILDACVQYKVKRVLFASTIYVYSKYGSFYRCSKQASEIYIENYHEVYGLNYTIMRYGSLYGKRANHFNSISNLIKQAIQEKKIVRGGDGEEIRDYIHVKDAARASVELMSSDRTKDYVMLTGSQPMRIKDLLNMIKEMFDNKIEIEYLGDPGPIVGHYNITPYTFKPKVARKYVLDYYYDLGQGILDCIYDLDNQLKESVN